MLVDRINVVGQCESHHVGGLTFAFTLGSVKDLTGSFSAALLILAALCGVSLACTLALPAALRAVPPSPSTDLAA